MNKWFKVENYLAENNLDVLNDPSRVFNADETAFYLNPKDSKVMAEKENKYVYDRSQYYLSLNSKCCWSVSFNYDCFQIPITLHVAYAVTPNWTTGKSEKGYMIQELFYGYMFFSIQ